MSDFCTFVPDDPSCQTADDVPVTKAAIVLNPIFAAHDLENVFEIPSDSGLNSDLGGR